MYTPNKARRRINTFFLAIVHKNISLSGPLDFKSVQGGGVY